MLGWKNTKLILVSLAAIFAVAGVAHADKINVAVFNFQMKSDTPNYKWLEKGLADQMTNDFFRDEHVTVLARDQMQVLAAQYNWVPEFYDCRFAKLYEEIQKQVAIKYIISGLYAINGDAVELIGQILDVKQAKEVHRVTVSGKLADVLDLRRQLSAKMLAWFSKGSESEIYDRLPVWTKNMDAARSLYEGIDLYDQGRYEEAWQRFRRASSQDKQYPEAQYWIGRMYYFMSRDEHARIEYDRFVYANPTHPRVGDAIREYLHTYERNFTDLNSAMSVYDQLTQKYPDVMIKGNVYANRGDKVDVPVSTWVSMKKAQFQSALGGYEDAMSSCVAALQCVKNEKGWAIEDISNFAIKNVIANHMMTGKVVMPEFFKDQLRKRYGNDFFRQCVSGMNEIKFRQPLRSVREVVAKNSPYARCGCFVARMLLAPEGYIFKRVTIKPVIKADEKVEFLVSVGDQDIPGQSLETQEHDIKDAVSQGVKLENIQRTGMLFLNMHLHYDHAKDANVSFEGLMVDVELEKLGAHGAVELVCLNTDNYIAYVDGVKSTFGNGIVGLFPPGRHEVLIQPNMQVWGREHFEGKKFEVDIEEGKVVRKEFSLGWTDKSPWRSWQTAHPICDRYPLACVALDSDVSAPAIYADDKSIYVAWRHNGDLWSAISADGQTFSPAKQLEMPVSSGWIEADPRLIRGEDGRFVMAMTSDRQGSHLRRSYVCWSRDFDHWSRPVMVADKTFATFDIIQDMSGRYIFVGTGETDVEVYVSDDLNAWRKIGSVKTDCQKVHGVAIAIDSDGKYQLFVGMNYNSTGVKFRYGVYSSDDAVAWQLRGKEMRLPHDSAAILSAANKGVYLGYSSDGKFVVHISDCPDYDYYEVGGSYFGLSGPAAFFHHPRWGYMLAWMGTGKWRYSSLPETPIFMRGPGFEKWQQPASATSQPSTQTSR